MSRRLVCNVHKQEPDPDPMQATQSKGHSLGGIALQTEIIRFSDSQP